MRFGEVLINTIPSHGQERITAYLVGGTAVVNYVSMIGVTFKRITTITYETGKKNERLMQRIERLYSKVMREQTTSNIKP